MRIVFVHNFYLQSGGEDAVFNAESNMLERYGHEVTRYTVSNEEISTYSGVELAGSTLWNQSHYRKIRQLFNYIKPDIAHVHNTMPILSPSIYHAARVENIPIVQMMHNYRPFCLNGVLYRDGKICVDCVGRYPIPGVLHKCYRGSLSASAGVFALYLTHYELLRTYQRSISIFIASTEFVRNLLIRMGLQGDKIMVKPNLVNVMSDIDWNALPSMPDRRAVYVGRLDDRKGVHTLLAALDQINIPITLVGDGDLRPEIEKWVFERPGRKVEITGWLDRGEVIHRLKSASMLIFPSEFYESFGNVIVEAFSCGVPVVTTNIGAQAELVNHLETGLIFESGNADDLAVKVNWLCDHPGELIRLGRNARKEYEEKYTPERNYQQLMEIYQRAIRQSK